MKRVLCLILAVVIIISLVAIPAFATDVSDFTNTVNILDQASNFTFSNYNYERSFVSPEFTLPYSDLDDSFGTSAVDPHFDFSINFYEGKSFFSNNYRFVFISNLTIEQLIFTYYDFNGDEVQVLCSFSSEFMYNGTYLYSGAFMIDCRYMTDPMFRIFFRGSQTLDSVFFQFEEFTYYFRSVSWVNNLNVKAVGTVHNREDSSYYSQVFYDQNISLETGIRLTNDNMSSITSDAILNFVATIEAPNEDVDQFKYVFRSTGVWPNYYDTGSLSNASLVVNGNEVYVNIPYNAAVRELSNFSVDGLPVYEIVITADLPDMLIYSLEFSTTVHARYPNTSSNFAMYYYCPLFVEFSYDHISTDNNFINTLYSRFQLLFNSLNSSISTQFNNLRNLISTNIVPHLESIRTYVINSYTRLGTINNNLITFYTRVVTDFTSLLNKLDQYFSVPAGTAPPDASDQQQGIEDSINDMDDIADDFSGVGDEIDQLLPSTPSYEDTGLSGAADIASTRILELRAVFVVLWDNSFIIQLLTFSCLLALGGFILFGER